MTNKKGTKRSLLMSALAMLLCVSMLIGSTFAWFTDSVTSAGNIIKSGTLDVEMYWADGTEAVPAADSTAWTNAASGAIFNYDKWEPGYTEVRHIKIANVGTLALKYQLMIEAEDEVSDLAKVIDVYFLDPAEAIADRTALNEDDKIGTLDQVLAGMPRSTSGALEAKKDATITLALKMQESATNEYQDKSIGTKFAVKLLATQLTAENDSFGPDYDEDAWADGMKVTNANELQAAINNGLDPVLQNDIELSEPIVIPAPAASTFSLRAAPNATVIDLNGKTLTGTKGRDADNNRIHVIVNNGILTIKNGTVKSAGNDGGSAIYNNAGATLTIEDVTLYGAPQSDPVYEAGVSKPFPSYAVNNYGNAVLNGATVKSYHGAIATGGNGVTVINDADIDVGLGQSTGITSYAIYSYENAQVTVNGGKFAFTKQEVYVNGGNTFCELGTNPIMINGGNYIGTSFSTGADREYVIKGGTFDADPSAYVAPGYQATNNGDGSYTVLFPQESFDSLINNAGAGDTVAIPAGTYTFPASKLQAGMTLECAEGTVFEGASGLNVNGATIIGATFSNDGGNAVSGTVNGTFKDCTFTGTNGLRGCYAGETVVFENCVFDGAIYGMHFDGGSNDAVFKNCTFSGFNAMGAALTKLTMEGCTFKATGKSAYNGINLWGDTEMIGCTFVFDGTASTEWVDLANSGKTVSFTDCVVTDGKTTKGIETVVGNYGTGNTIIIDGKEMGLVSNEASLSDALANGGDVVMANDVTLTGKVITTNGITEAYGNKVGVAQYGGTLDGSGNTLTETGSSAYVIVTHGGTIKNLTIVGGGRGIVIYAPTEDVIIDNVVIDGPGYAINTAEHNGQDLIVTNSTVNGWTSLAGLDSVSFTNCKFGENSTKCWQNYGYDADYDRLIRPYGQTSFTDCTFEKNFYIDLSALANGNTVTLTNCNCEGVVLTAENYANYITVELPDWATSIADCIVFN